VWHVCYHEL